MFLHPSPYRKKLNGWLSYAFASEVFVIVSLTLFLPICLEQFARDNGYLLPDLATPCSSVTPPPTTGRANAAGVVEQRCAVKIGWFWVDTASFSLYVYSISVALQALTVISMGGIADHPSHRKSLLLGFAALGSTAATLFLFLSSSSTFWPLSALLALCSNVGFGASTVAMNAYIPSLAKEAPEVVALSEHMELAADSPESSIPVDADDHRIANSEDSSAPLLGRTNGTSDTHMGKLKAQHQELLSRATSRISSVGIATGYIAGICLLIVALVPVTKMKGSTFSLRLAIGLSGIWWAVFTLPAALWLPRGHPEKQGGEGGRWSDDANTDQRDSWNVRREISAAWIRLFKMLRYAEMKKLRNTFKFLAAWFLLSDGFTTITSTALLFGKTTLHMSPSALILIGVLTPTSGILGSLAWPYFQRKFNWSNLKVLLILITLASLIPLYGCLGFVTQGRFAFGGLTTQEEMFGLAIYFGSVYGAFQGYSRAFYAELLPPGEEARWYGLFSITDKSSSFIGPLVVGIIADMTGNIRYSFFFLVLMVWAAIPLLTVVDVDQGRKDAQQYVYESQPVYNTTEDD